MLKREQTEKALKRGTEIISLQTLFMLYIYIRENCVIVNFIGIKNLNVSKG
jgi:hypothetical protein